MPSLVIESAHSIQDYLLYSFFFLVRHNGNLLFPVMYPGVQMVHVGNKTANYYCPTRIVFRIMETFSYSNPFFTLIWLSIHKQKGRALEPFAKLSTSTSVKIVSF